MTTIALAMIAKVGSEHDRAPDAFRRALSSADPVVRRVVVVLDDRSHPLAARVAIDSSTNIVDVVSRTWTGDFSAARNAVHEHTSAEWLVVVDADEELEPGDLRQVIEDAPDDVDAVTVEVVIYTDGEPQRQRQIRAYRRERCHWERRVHNRLVGWSKVAHSSARIVTSYAGKGEDRARRQIAMCMRELIDDPDDVHALRYLGRSLLRLGQPADAVTPLARCCELAGTDPLYAEAWTDLSRSLAMAGDMDRAEAVARDGLVHHPGNPSLLHHLLGLSLVRWAVAMESPGDWLGVAHFRPENWRERVGYAAQALGLPIGVLA